MSEHTKLIAVGKFSEDICTVDAQGKPVRKVAYTHRGEDARRLVACWNACDQYTTEQLESGILSRDRATIIESSTLAATLAVENEELVRALRDAMEHVDGDYIGITHARALLAKHQPPAPAHSPQPSGAPASGDQSTGDCA